MELAFQTSRLPYLRRAAQEVRYQEETAETIVPDSDPDIASIADCSAEAYLRGKDCRDGNAVISGGIKAVILYNPEDGSHPRRLDFYIPFTVRFENAALTERSQVLAQIRVRSADGRMINSRKAMARVSLGCEITAYEPDEETLYALQGLCEGLQTRQSTVQITLPLETAERAFTVTDTLELPAGRPPVTRIYKACCQLELTDQKLVGNKGVFKGNLLCKLLYLSENQTLYLWQQQLPFSQYCELQGDYDEERMTVLPALTGFDLEPEGGEEIRRVLVNVGILAQCTVSGVRPLELTEDAYCTKGVLKPEWKTYQMDGCLDRQSSQQTLRENLSGSLREILDTDLYVDFPVLERQGDQVRAKVPVTLRVLGTDENGSLAAMSGKSEAAREFALSDQAGCRLLAQPSGECYASLTASGAEVRCGLTMESVCYGRQDLRTLCGGAVEEAPQTTRPSVILRAARRDEALWDIAKASGSTVDAIRSVNRLDGDRAPEGTMLLIPVGSI